MPIRARKSGPAFKLGDRVRITFPGVHRGKRGEVVEILDHRGDYVYRYRIRFDDGETATSFEFEVERVLAA
jgi:hypothetical protein